MGTIDLYEIQQYPRSGRVAYGVEGRVSPAELRAAFAENDYDFDVDGLDGLLPGRRTAVVCDGSVAEEDIEQEINAYLEEHREKGAIGAVRRAFRGIL